MYCQEDYCQKDYCKDCKKLKIYKEFELLGQWVSQYQCDCNHVIKECIYCKSRNVISSPITNCLWFMQVCKDCEKIHRSRPNPNYQEPKVLIPHYMGKSDNVWN